MPIKVILGLQGRFIPIETLAAAINDLCDLLAQLDVSISGKEHIYWGVKAMRSRNGSAPRKAIIEAFPHSLHGEDHDLNVAHKIIPALLAGTKEIAKKPVRPEFFSDGALDSLKDLAAIASGDVEEVFVNGSLNGKAHRAIRLKPTIRTNVDELIGPRYRSIGSVEGSLDTVSLHRGPRIFVYHHITRRAVRCTFDREMIEEVKTALGQRVVASGIVHYNRQGDPLRVEMEHLRVIARGNLPTTAELTGSMEWPDGLSTDDYIRSIRGG